ncbi:methyltransferase domain-containing protein [Actinomadura roseirufa]|uniref:methyltransferase domain-containing protein n=1 Tax=Actinomadura roseirufa TaxID=2094049 RepID=UPI00104139FD|nr:methyltransferase domain-containing protein [Actinomadura roseirufa]
MNQAERLNRAMIREIEKLGDIGPWHDALLAVPRHLFIPNLAYVSPDDDESYIIDRSANPEKWLRSAYMDVAIITQINDGECSIMDAGKDGVRFTSSASAPSTVIAFLSLLGASKGHNVLEIGTGTGWTAALLSAVVGDHKVTSIEIDEEIGNRAAQNLRSAGYAPHLVTGDGAEGVPGKAPFDRIHVTCGIDEIPPQWIDQTKRGGILVAPYRRELVSLVVHEDGEATVKHYGRARFMMLRSPKDETPKRAAI